MPGTGGVILCQPGGRRGCSLCCGLFNLRDVAKHALSAFLDGGASRVETLPDMYGDDTGPFHASARDVTSYICPFQGFLDLARPGCLLHRDHGGTDRRYRSLFGKKICGDYLCPAHSLLPDREKKELIRLVDDWYLYTIAILDPLTFSMILECAARARGCGGDSRRRALLLRGLSFHAGHLAALEGPLFCYSEAEYREHRAKVMMPERHQDLLRREIEYL